MPFQGWDYYHHACYFLLKNCCSSDDGTPCFDIKCQPWTWTLLAVAVHQYGFPASPQFLITFFPIQRKTYAPFVPAKLFSNFEKPLLELPLGGARWFSNFLIIEGMLHFSFVRQLTIFRLNISNATATTFFCKHSTTKISAKGTKSCGASLIPLKSSYLPSVILSNRVNNGLRKCFFLRIWVTSN